MEFLEQPLRLELQKPEGKSGAGVRDAAGRLPPNLPPFAGLRGATRSVPRKCAHHGANLHSTPDPRGVVSDVSPFLHSR